MQGAQLNLADDKQGVQLDAAKILFWGVVCFYAVNKTFFYCKVCFKISYNSILSGLLGERNLQKILGCRIIMGFTKDSYKFHPKPPVFSKFYVKMGETCVKVCKFEVKTLKIVSNVCLKCWVETR